MIKECNVKPADIESMLADCADRWQQVACRLAPVMAATERSTSGYGDIEFAFSMSLAQRAISKSTEACISSISFLPIELANLYAFSPASASLDDMRRVRASILLRLKKMEDEVDGSKLLAELAIAHEEAQEVDRLMKEVKELLDRLWQQTFMQD